MKKARKALCALLALVMLTGLVPAGLLSVPVSAEDVDIGDPPVIGTNEWNIATAEDWEQLVDAAQKGEVFYTDITLVDDITLSGNIHAVENLTGCTIDGQGHTITIADGAALTFLGDENAENHTGSIGLFSGLTDCTVRDLNIHLAGQLNGTTLTSPKQVPVTMGIFFPTMYPDYNDYLQIRLFGVLAGSVSGSTIERVAVTGDTFRVVANSQAYQHIYMGALVGELKDSSLSSCYVGVSAEGWYVPESKEHALVMGGLAGYASNSTIANCLHAGGYVYSHHSVPDVLNNRAGLAGGLVGEMLGGSISDSVVQDTELATYDIGPNNAPAGTPVEEFGINYGWNNGTTGLITTTDAATSGGSFSRCYALGSTASLESNTCNTFGAFSGSTAESDAKQVLAGGSSGVTDTWLVDADGQLGLTWMYQVPQVSAQTVDNGRDVTFTVTQRQPLSALEDGDTETKWTWDYTVQANIRGRKPTPAAPTGKITEEAEITGGTIYESRKGAGEQDTVVTPGKGNSYYSGGQYQFYVQFTGSNLEEEDLPAVTWTVTDDANNSGTEIQAASITADGLLKVNYPYYGELTIEANAPNVTIDPVTITVSPPTPTILSGTQTSNFTVKKGKTIDFKVEWTNAFFPENSVPGVVWEVKAAEGQELTGAVFNTEIDATTGALYVCWRENCTQLVVTAYLKGADGQKIEDVSDSVNVTVGAGSIAEKVEQTIEVTGEKTINPSTVSIQAGQQLILTANVTGTSPAAPDGYEGTPTVSTTFGEPSDTNTLTGSAGSYTASEEVKTATTVTIPVTTTFAFEKAPEPEPGPGGEGGGEGGNSNTTTTPPTTSTTTEPEDSTDQEEGGAAAGSGNEEAQGGGGAAQQDVQQAPAPQNETDSAPRTTQQAEMPRLAGEAGTVTWSGTLTVKINPPVQPSEEGQVDDTATPLVDQVNGDQNTVQFDQKGLKTYLLNFAADAGNTSRRYMLTDSETAPATDDSGWIALDESETPVTLDADQVEWLTASGGSTLYLWMYQAYDEINSSSAVVGYHLTVNEVNQTIDLEELADHPADPGAAGQSGLTARGTITVVNGNITELSVENGQTEPHNGQNISVLELLNEFNRTNYTSLTTGEVSVTVTAGSANWYKDGAGEPFAASASASSTVGSAALKPTIQPRGGSSVLPDNCFSIDVPAQENAVVYYQVFENTTSVSADRYQNLQSTGTRYTPGAAIPFPTGCESITVAAQTYIEDGESEAHLPSDADVVTYTKDNLARPDAPELRMGEEDAVFSSTEVYDDGTVFGFFYPARDNLSVYYTTNGRDPDVANGEGRLYNAESKPTLQFGVSAAVTVKAVVYDSTYGLQSAVATFTVQRRAAVDAVVPSLSTGAVVRNNDTVTLELPQSFVDTLGETTSFLEAGYFTYTQSEFESQYGGYVQSGGDEPVEGARYLLVNTGSNTSTGELPQIRYLLNDAESGLKDMGILYQYAVCQVWNVSQTDDDGVTTVQWYYRFVNPDQITISGEPDAKVSLRAAAFAPSGVQSYTDGAEATFTYTIRSTVATPTAVPGTDTQGATTVNVGDRIALTGDPDTYIYYTTNGSQPRVSWNEEAGQWEIESESTLLYDENQSITVTSDESLIFIIHALAVSADNSLESSALATFVYTVSPLPKAAAPTATPVTDPAEPTQLAQGEIISLHTTTLNSDIFYTTDGSVPDPDARLDWEEAYEAASSKGTDEDTGLRYYTQGGQRVTEPATFLYDVQKGIPMGATRQQQLFVVTAMVREKEMETPTTAESDAVSFVYQLARAQAPQASPTPEDGTAITVEPGSLITLTTGTVGAAIYYTTDTTLPDVTDPEAVAEAWENWQAAYEKADEDDRGTEGNGVRYYLNGSTKVHEPSTKPYIAEEGIQMPEGVTTFFTIRAVAVVADGTRADSDVATFAFQLPAPVQAVYASPVDGTAVQYGDQVTLACGTEGAQIFYKIFTEEPDEDDVPVVNKDLLYTQPITVREEVWIRAIATRQGMRSAVTTYHYTVAPTAAAPTISLPTGSVVFRGTRVQLSGEGTIVFTTDGSDPKTSDTVQYGRNVNLDGEYGDTVTVRAYIQRDGHTPSETVSFSYTICGEDDYLIASVPSGSTVANHTALTLSTGITGGRIFYTVDGSTPVVNNVFTTSEGRDYTAYEWTAGLNTYEGSSLSITGVPDSALTVKATVVANGSDGGTVATFTYKLQPQTAAPAASIPSGAVVMDGAAVTLTAPEGVIYYTTDGSEPTTSSSVYAQPIDVSTSASVTLRAIAVAEGKAASSVAVFRYTRAGQVSAPSFSQTAGEIDTGTTVAITSATAGASVYYSTDGTDPSADNLDRLSLYVAPISVTRAVTIKAIAVRDGMEPSEVRTATYTVRKPVPVEEPQEEEPPTQTTVTDRLTSRRTYASGAQGPTYSDVVLRESVCNTVLSAPEGAVPANAVLTVRSVEPTRADEASVDGSLGQAIARVYEAQLTIDGDSVRPSAQVELGFAIPAEYQNGVVTVSRINDDGTLTQFSARRSGGIAYVQTDTMGRFVLSVPDAGDGGGLPWNVILWTGGGLALALLVLLLVLARRRRRQDEEQAVPDADGIESLEDFQNYR